MQYGDPDSPIYNSTAIDDTVFYDWGNKNGYNVTIINTDDANTKSEKNNPRADVVIGLDNALLALAKQQGYASEILEKYTPKNSSHLRQDLIQQLDPEFLLTPIDYGALAFYYDLNDINETIVPNLNNLTVDDLFNPDLAKKLILEDPLSSSPGTGFLLWSIASYKLQNKYNNWQSFWNHSVIKNDVLITPSWGDGFVALGTTDRSILMSYATSPAYDRCVYNYNETSAFFTHENGTKNSWLQIEGVGLVKNGPHPDIGKEFIDWMISVDVQKLIPVTNWMYPANSIAQNHLPDCFNEGAISPDDLFILNNVLPINEVQNNLASWLNEWDLIRIGGTFLNLKFTPYPTNKIQVFVVSNAKTKFAISLNVKILYS
jgi:thiamine transport system substrate-binding protein